MGFLLGLVAGAILCSGGKKCHCEDCLDKRRSSSGYSPSVSGMVMMK